MFHAANRHMTARFHEQVLVFIGFAADGAFFTKAGPRLVARPSRSVAGVPCTDLSTIDVDKAVFPIGTGLYASFISPG
jgi:hypothetical protein